MEMPKPTPDHERLRKLAGHWRGTEHMHPSPWDPEGGDYQALTRSRVALDGFAVIVDYEQSRDGKSTFQGHGVYTWDPHAKQVVLHWFDSMGQGVDEFRGGWQGDRLELTSKNPMGLFRMRSDLSEAGRMTSRMENSSDGQSWKTMFDGTYTREK